VTTEKALQRTYDMRTVCNSWGWVVRTMAPWRNRSQDLPQSKAVYRYSQPQLKARVWAALVRDLRVLLRLAEGRHALLSAALLESRMLQSSPECSTGAG